MTIVSNACPFYRPYETKPVFSRVKKQFLKFEPRTNLRSEMIIPRTEQKNF